MKILQKFFILIQTCVSFTESNRQTASLVQARDWRLFGTNLLPEPKLFSVPVLCQPVHVPASLIFAPALPLHGIMVMPARPKGWASRQEASAAVVTTRERAATQRTTHGTIPAVATGRAAMQSNICQQKILLCKNYNYWFFTNVSYRVSIMRTFKGNWLHYKTELCKFEIMIVKHMHTAIKTLLYNMDLVLHGASPSAGTVLTNKTNYSIDQ